MKCKICGAISQHVFSKDVFTQKDIKYYQCPECKFVQTEQPYWLREAYENALNLEDTGLIRRNEYFREKLTPLFYFNFDKTAAFIDYAGGYGVFTRMMRDAGFDYYWTDKYAQNMMARGFEHIEGRKYEALTAFEVFEHLENPLSEIETMFSFSDNIIFSTLLLPDELPAYNWWYYAFHHGQHIAFYHKKSLRFLAKNFGANLYTNGSNLHILSRKKLKGFNILTKASKYGLYALVKTLMSSKTENDSKKLKR